MGFEHEHLKIIFYNGCRQNYYSVGLFSLQVNMCLHKLGFWYHIHETSDEPISETDTQILIEKWDMVGTEKKNCFLTSCVTMNTAFNIQMMIFFFLKKQKLK